jgi:5-methylcytosine-specific restriction endonuclease McrA
MIRHSKVDIRYLDQLKDKNGRNQYDEINGIKVKITSQRYEVFKKNRCCVTCGVVGSFLALEMEENMQPKPTAYHLNMYAIDSKGVEVLMTKDHIKPKSKGGKNIQDNYQTMCQVCNGVKGNGDKSVKDLFNLFVYNKTKDNIKLIDQLCLELKVDPQDFWSFYLKSLGDFSETDFLTEMLTYFHWYLESTFEKLYDSVGIKMDTFFFNAEDDKIYFNTYDNAKGRVEFTEKVMEAEFDTKKKLMSNKIFAYFMKKTNLNIFTSKQIRALKLEKINK